MNDHQIKLAKTPNSQLTMEELKEINSLVARVKRAAEIATIIPGALDELREDDSAFCKKYGLDLTEDDRKSVKLIVLPEYIDEKAKIWAYTPREGATNEDIDNFLAMMPEGFYRYYQFIQNKIYVRNLLKNKIYVPTNERVKQWRERQVNRCLGALGGINESFVHALTTFEIADGCSVGCDFCGLSAGKLKKLFRYTPENAKLFRDVLKICHEVLGGTAAAGMLYFATEPLDNPDYQQFEDDFYNEFHIIPQITTAVADRDIERTRSFVHELYTKKGTFIHRFTIRSLEMAEKIFNSFTPEELVKVELLPQFPEAPGFTQYTKVGNEAKKDDEKKSTVDQNGIELDPGTICCIDGFRINFARKEISVFTPCHMSAENPNGIAVARTLPFEDGDDFREKLNYLIDEYMVNEIPKDEKLKIYDYFKLRYDNERGNVLQSIYGGETVLLDKLNDGYMVSIIEALMEGKYTKHELANKILEEHKVPAENTMYFINQLWKKGFIVDTKFFSH